VNASEFLLAVVWLSLRVWLVTVAYVVAFCVLLWVASGRERRALRTGSYRRWQGPMEGDSLEVRGDC